MRRHLHVLTVLAAFAAPCGLAQAQTVTAAKIDSINKAADAIVAMAKNSEVSGKPPRYSDPAVKPLFETVFNTKDLEGGKPLPWASVEMLHEWNQATLKVGLVYYLAGTGTNDPTAVSRDPQKIQKANSNTAAFTYEFGRYYDAQMRILGAMIDAAIAQSAAATPEQRRDPTLRRILNNISDDTARAITGLLGTFVIDGMPDNWQLLRVVALLDITPKATKFLAPDDRNQLKNAAAEVADHVTNPDVKSGVNAVARAFAGI